ncbi:MAG: CtsR family transcriptional regulator [Clostridiales bacterium]|nr:CtsR family transcriptional regulator [Clostridiales bacterium]
MSNISDLIEQFILSAMSGSGETILKRNDLANRFDCASSQINYVLNTRFTVDKGYSIESRRGGGGYIRLFRMEGGEEYFKTILNGIKGGSLSYNKCTHIMQRLIIDGLMTERERELLAAALSDKSLSVACDKEKLRRSIMTEVIIGLWKDTERED